MREAVVLVHGIWQYGPDLWRMNRLIKSAGYDVYRFNYPSRRKTPAENARDMASFVSTIQCRTVHFVCHSFGGIVLLHMFDQKLFNKDGRVVLLGSPVMGSRVARRMASRPLSRWVLGKSIDRGITGGAPQWRDFRDIGVIAGSVPLGAGLLVGGPEAPHDGTVSVYETVLDGATDSIILPVSHSGMLYSLTVATQVVTFLRAGRFGDEAGNLLFDVSNA